MSFSDKLLNIIIAFSIFFVLIYCCYVTLQLQDMWSMIINSQEIIDEHKKDLRNLISVVSQETSLFDDTIRSNILMGETIKTDKELCNVLKDSSVSQFLDDLPNGLDSVVGPRGINLSGGQRQRIGIARALYNYPEIIVLDEATSSLDGLTENYVMDSIESLSKEVTTIIIAHRLSTIKECDCIYFIKNGQIENYGTYNELYENNQEFR